MNRLHGLSSIKIPLNHTVVTMGNFDGMHRGHRVIVSETVRQAKTLDCSAVAYTFYPHPVKMLAPHSCPPLIQTIEQRLESFEALGIDTCVVDTFNHNLAQLTPSDFFSQIIIDKLGAKGLVVGYDFTFGVHRRGTVDVLKHLGKEHGIAVTVIEAQFREEMLISSTEIRRYLLEGDVEHAAELMEAPFALRGTVIRGHGIGKTLGAHTANIDVENELKPMEGVYITRARIIGDDRIYPSIASLGVNPTFNGGPFQVETHLIDFDGNLLGKRIDLLFYKRIRGQVAFDSPDTLRGQIQRDIEVARKWHEDNRI